MLSCSPVLTLMPQHLLIMLKQLVNAVKIQRALPRSSNSALSEMSGVRASVTRSVNNISTPSSSLPPPGTMATDTSTGASCIRRLDVPLGPLSYSLPVTPQSRAHHLQNPSNSDDGFLWEHQGQEGQAGQEGQEGCASEYTEGLWEGSQGWSVPPMPSSVLSVDNVYDQVTGGGDGNWNGSSEVRREREKNEHKDGYG
ncbi:unnamed protein product, partial [Discosporangium mesarthrocarpum]